MQISSIEPHRVSQILQTLRYNFLEAIPVEQLERINYSASQIEAFEDFLHHLRDTKEALAFDRPTQEVFDEDTVMTLFVILSSAISQASELISY